MDAGVLRFAAEGGAFDGGAWWGGPHRLRGAVVDMRGCLRNVDSCILNVDTQLLFLIAEDRCPRRNRAIRWWGAITAADLEALVDGPDGHVYDEPGWPEGFRARLRAAAPSFVERFALRVVPKRKLLPRPDVAAGPEGAEGASVGVRLHVRGSARVHVE